MRGTICPATPVVIIGASQASPQIFFRRFGYLLRQFRLPLAKRTGLPSEIASALWQRVCTFKPSLWKSKRKKIYLTSRLIKRRSRNGQLLKTAGAPPRNAFNSKPEKPLSRGVSIVAQMSWPQIAFDCTGFDVLKCGSRDSLTIVLPLLRSLEQAAAVLGETMRMNTQQFSIVCEPLETTFALRSV